VIVAAVDPSLRVESRASSPGRTGEAASHRMTHHAVKLLDLQYILVGVPAGFPEPATAVLALTLLNQAGVHMQV